MAGSLILSGNQFYIAGPATEKARCVTDFVVYAEISIQNKLTIGYTPTLYLLLQQHIRFYLSLAIHI